MSEAVSALAGEAFDGIVRVEEAGLRGMILLRGDLSDTTLTGAATGVTGTAFPGRGEAKLQGEKGILWMSPDEALVLVPHAEAGAALGAMRKDLKGTHHLLADVSDARAVFRVTGAAAREVLAKLTPADLSPAAFGPGQVRRTRLAQAAAAFWMTGEDAFEVVCFRSVARYVFDLLKTSARPGGEVGFF